MHIHECVAKEILQIAIYDLFVGLQSILQHERSNCNSAGMADRCYKRIIIIFIMFYYAIMAARQNNTVQCTHTHKCIH